MRSKNTWEKKYHYCYTPIQSHVVQKGFTRMVLYFNELKRFSMTRIFQMDGREFVKDNELKVITKLPLVQANYC